jgi:hypothetical protein
LFRDKARHVGFLSLCIVRPKWFDRLQIVIRKLATFLYNTAVNLKIFSLRDFGSDVNRTTAKQLGQYATRLYIILFSICLVVLTLYTIVQPQALTKTFDEPLINAYKGLIQDYGDKLKCSCSLIASPYHRFVEIEPVFHEVRKYFTNRLATKGTVEMMLLKE